MEEEASVKGGGKQEEGRSSGGGGGVITYCVTGASGYIGSWLVKSLLLRGYNVHATVRNLEKSMYLLQHWEGGERVKLFKADLQEEGSFDEAMRGCHGLFHVAASMEFDVQVKENIDSYVERKVVEPAIKGTLNVMKSCLRSGSIKRVVFTSSTSTLTSKDSLGNWKSCVDETSSVSIDQVWKNKASGWVYVLCKLLTEQAAFDFSKENELDIVSVITTTVAGPFLTCTVPASIRFLLSPLKGDPLLSSMLSTVNSRMGSIGMVHVEDICNAHIFLMEHSSARGQYICCESSYGMSQLITCFKEHYPSYSSYSSYSSSSLLRIVGEEHDSIRAEVCSNKLKELGFNYIYSVKDIIRDTIAKCMECGFL